MLDSSLSGTDKRYATLTNVTMARCSANGTAAVAITAVNEVNFWDVGVSASVSTLGSVVSVIQADTFKAAGAFNVSVASPAANAMHVQAASTTGLTASVLDFTCTDTAARDSPGSVRVLTPCLCVLGAVQAHQGRSTGTHRRQSPGSSGALRVWCTRTTCSAAATKTRRRAGAAPRASSAAAGTAFAPARSTGSG